MWAVYKNHYACAQLLIQFKAHVNLVDEEDSLTPLIVAAGRGYVNFVELLIGAGAEVNFISKNWQSIHEICMFCQLMANFYRLIDFSG